MTRSAGVFGSVTMLSRVLGLLRDVLSAGLFGTTQVWDAFVTAFTIPNMFRMMLGEGALSGAFVPIFTRYLHSSSEQQAWSFANKIISLLSVVLIGIIVIGWGILAVMYHMALPERIHLIVLLSIILLPYLFFICNVGLLMGILNTFHHFFIGAFCPVILNATLIFLMILYIPFSHLTELQKIYILSVGVVLGGALQFFSHWIVASKKGLRFTFSIDIHDKGVAKVWRLMLPAVMALSVTQINLVVDRVLALFIGEGAASALYYSNRIIQLPIGVFGVALATTSFPLMAHYSAVNDMPLFKKTISHVIQLMLFISLPATCGLLVLSYPLIRMIFEHSQFDADSTSKTAFALIFYSIGLCSYCCNKVIIRGFYSLQDTRTPVRVGVITLIINVVFNVVLMYPLKQGGLALSTSIASFVGTALLVFGMNKKIGVFYNTDFWISIRRILFASFIMMAAVYVSYRYLYLVLSATLWNNILILGIPLCIGITVYMALMYFLKSQELFDILELIGIHRSVN
ncbi:murein biosynthesis integral membrane protein MurJ [bacterium]|nr:murein biosynthesis integral membrane protein MurJ [bacterium]MCP5462502.1 murein biosynthesis integral membrane protein MurJ [bacterium]